MVSLQDSVCGGKTSYLDSQWNKQKDKVFFFLPSLCGLVWKTLCLSDGVGARKNKGAPASEGEKKSHHILGF